MYLICFLKYFSSDISYYFNPIVLAKYQASGEKKTMETANLNTVKLK